MAVRPQALEPMRVLARVGLGHLKTRRNMGLTLTDLVLAAFAFHFIGHAFVQVEGVFIRRRMDHNLKETERLLRQMENTQKSKIERVK